MPGTCGPCGYGEGRGRDVSLWSCNWILTTTHVNLDQAKPLAQLLLLLRRQVLVAEEHDAALGDEQGELVPLVGREVLELDALDLGADVGGEVGHLGRGGEQVLLALVGARAGIDVVPRLAADLVYVVEEERARRPVRVPVGQVDAGRLETRERGDGQPQSVLSRLGHVRDGGIDGCGGHFRRRLGLLR